MKLPQLHVGVGMQCGAATFFPVWVDARATKGLVTGTEAKLGVNELSTPEVSRLTVTNQGTKAALLTEGQLLEGGQQHRMAAQTTLIGAGETANIKVVCVEQGRWNGSPVHLNTGRRAPFHVQAGLHMNGSDHQDAVWQRVQRYEGIRTNSATGSLVKHLDLPRPQGFLLPNLLDGQRGLIIGIEGQVLSLELFGSRKLFRRHFAAVMDALVLDLLLFRNPAGRGATRPVRAQAARDFVGAIASNGLGLRNQSGHRGNAGSIPVRRIENGHSSLPVSGLSIWGTEGTQPQIAHLSAWNAKHGVFT
ncbi:ARPP-1 family domain-containing protein [Arthrobacter sp. STN4]|uniref:ARPP-1 family domain-containing protein n=1 Tax=Arthrobacter sp. STN4 TaxID=2923276 RepID=UPI00211A7E93|nr:DUF6569 family protein [Arthrobacter sp. STN4]MCQ9164911.1 hypothetical protein [Arthrobacter sp. STN4]